MDRDLKDVWARDKHLVLRWQDVAFLDSIVLHGVAGQNPTRIDLVNPQPQARRPSTVAGTIHPADDADVAILKFLKTFSHWQMG